MWYTTSDFSLNIHAHGTEYAIDGEYHRIIVSEDGSRVGVGKRTRGTEEDFVAFSAADRSVAWTVRLENGLADIVGFGVGDSVIVNQVGHATDDNPSQIVP